MKLKVLLKNKKKTKYIRTKNEINKNLKNNKFKYCRNDIAEKVFKSCRGVKKGHDKINRLDKEKERQNFRQLLGFKENEVFESKEYSVVKLIKKVFKKQKIIDQYGVGKYFIDLYFLEHKLGTEIDENGHLDRSEIKEQEREATMKNAGITLIRINPGKKGLDIFDKISEIQDFIYESGLKLSEELKKNKIIDDLEGSAKMIKMSG